MKRVTYLGRQFLLDDGAADTLLEYATSLAAHPRPDKIEVRAIGLDDQEVSVALLLRDAVPFMIETADAVPFMIETANAEVAEPDNKRAVVYMKDQIARMLFPRGAVPSDPEGLAPLDNFDF